METRNPDAWSPGKRPLHNRLTMTTLIQTSSTAIKGKKTKDETEGDSKNGWTRDELSTHFNGYLDSPLLLLKGFCNDLGFPFMQLLS